MNIFRSRFTTLFLGMLIIAGLIFGGCSRNKSEKPAAKPSSVAVTPAQPAAPPTPLSPVTLKVNSWLMDMHGKVHKKYPDNIKNIAMLKSVSEGLDIMTVGLDKQQLQSLGDEIKKDFKKQFPKETTVLRFYTDGKQVLTYKVK
ncbi:MAG: hypothetical protein M1269_05415 [Chloroflexi bacterium]|nr:hypothetical protein [Chloroflexota bacterium]